MKDLILPQSIFWDFDYKLLDEHKNKRLILERVFTMGDIPEIKQIFKFYSIQTIKDEIIKIGFLDKKTLNWCSSYFNIPKTEFLCYKKQLSNPEHWNY